jgi:hypothetical protein
LDSSMIHTAINATYCPYRNRIAFALFILSLRQKNPSAPQRSEIFEKIVDQQRFSNINMKTSVSAQHSAGVLAAVPRLLAGAPRLRNRVRTEQCGGGRGRGRGRGGSGSGTHTWPYWAGPLLCPGKYLRWGGWRDAYCCCDCCSCCSWKREREREASERTREGRGAVGKQNKMND